VTVNNHDSEEDSKNSTQRIQRVLVKEPVAFHKKMLQFFEKIAGKK
jgi:hypothetical protein